jgi:hypothetical protein
MQLVVLSSRVSLAAEPRLRWYLKYMYGEVDECIWANMHCGFAFAAA